MLSGKPKNFVGETATNAFQSRRGFNSDLSSEFLFAHVKLGGGRWDFLSPNLQDLSIKKEDFLHLNFDENPKSFIRRNISRVEFLFHEISCF